jgi:hypothetical protein
MSCLLGKRFPSYGLFALSLKSNLLGFERGAIRWRLGSPLAALQCAASIFTGKLGGEGNIDKYYTVHYCKVLVKYFIINSVQN